MKVDVIVHLEMLEVTALLISKSNYVCIIRIVHRLILMVAYLPIALSLALMTLSISPREMGELYPESL